MNKKTTLITGASSGIGTEFARIHASKGDNLVLVARNEVKLNELKAELESEFQIVVTLICQDLAEQNAAKKVFEITNSKAISIDYLVNNAGFGDFGYFHETDWVKTEEMLQLNINCLTELSYLYSREMVKRKSGKILNVASTAAFQPGPMMAVYFATKAYVLHFSEAINNELNDFGITVTALCPGPTASNFFNAASMNDAKLIKGKKLPSPKEVALYGYNSMMKGKAVAIHGFLNKIMANSARFTPRNWVVKIVRKLQA